MAVCQMQRRVGRVVRPVGVALVLAALLAVRPAPVQAWGAVGHHVVARLAWALLTPGARDRASAILAGGRDEFIAAATWADEIRSARPETYNWHFVDIPVGQARYDEARDCPATDRGDCVILAIARARAVLADPQRPLDQQTEALKFLIHFVGDLHQPLHAVDNHDRGGNDVKVEPLRGTDGRATNLHAVWDTGLINLSDETEAARADRLLADVRSRPPAAGLDVVKWAEESHALAEARVYAYPGFSPAGPPANPIVLDESYRAQALLAIDRQMSIAGVRLAAILNGIFGAPGR